jgi:hypothetical protein
LLRSQSQFPFLQSQLLFEANEHTS